MGSIAAFSWLIQILTALIKETQNLLRKSRRDLDLYRHLVKISETNKFYISYRKYLTIKCVTFWGVPVVSFKVTVKFKSYFQLYFYLNYLKYGSTLAAFGI